MKKKQILALIICLSMILGLFPGIMFTASAAALPEGDMSINGINFTKSLGKFLGENQPDAIKLEAWVNGSVSLTESTPPTDIILVLDQSGSMDENISGTQTTKLDAMKEAVRAFSEKIASMNDEDNTRDDEYRVAIVGFASENSNTEILTNYNLVQTGTSNLDQSKSYYIFNGNNYEEIRYFNYSFIYPRGWYTVNFWGLKDDAVGEDEEIYEPIEDGAFVNCTSEAVSEDGLIDNAIEMLDGNGATRADLGFALAKDIFSNQPSGTYGGADGRQKVIIFLTDGVPTTASDFSPTVANDAINYAKEMKSDSTHIFSLYLGALESTDAGNFMQATSSNYPNATSYTELGAQAANSYCSAHTTATDISDVFVDIALTVQSLATINETAVVADTISEYYTFPGQTIGGEFIESQIQVYTVNWKGTDWEKAGSEEVLNPFNYATVSIDDATKEVNVTGFNFAYHCVTADPKNTAGTDYGRKLVVLIPVVLDPDAEHFGGYLPTNAGAGIYANADADEPLVPEADEYNDAIINYHLTATEKWYHLNYPDTSHTFYFTDPNVMNPILDEMIKDVPNGENNVGVNMKYYLYDTNGTPRYRDDDIPIAHTDLISSSEAVDVTNLENWTILVENVELTTENEDEAKIYALQCELQNLNDENIKLDVYALLSLGVVAENVHIVGGEIDDGGTISVEIPTGATPMFLDDNAYLERFEDGDLSRVMTFALKEGYEFSKIRVDTNTPEGIHSSDVIYDITDPLNNDTSIFDRTVFENDTYVYGSEIVSYGFAVVVETRPKRYILTTKQDDGSMITPYSPPEAQTKYSYDYHSTDKLKVEFVARSGHYIKSIKIDNEEYDPSVHGSMVSFNTETYIKEDSDNTVILSGEINFSKTADHSVEIVSDKREYKLTYQQYIRQWTQGGYVYNEDIGAKVELWLEFGEDLSTTVPVTDDKNIEVDGNTATYYFPNWFTTKNQTVFSGIVNPAVMTMPANNLTLYGYWAMTPNQTIPGSPIKVKKTVNVESDGSENNTFKFVATLNGAIVASVEETVPASSTEVEIDIVPQLTDAQYTYYINGTPILVYEESNTSKPWFYDRSIYEVTDGQNDHIVTKVGDTAQADGNIALFNNLSTEGFQVVYDLNGGTYEGNPSIPPKTGVSWSQTNLLPEQNPDKDAYNFAGWKIGEAIVTNEHSYGALAETPTVRTITLVAQWTQMTYTVKYDLAGGTLDGNPTVDDKTPVLWADANLLPAGTPEKTGRAFSGWYKDTTEVIDTMTYSELAGSDTVENITLVAQWIPKNYTVHYDLAGGTLDGNPTVADNTVHWEDANLLPSGTLVKSGYTFLGWYKDATQIDAAKTYAELAGADGVMEITLVAQWQQNSTPPGGGGGGVTRYTLTYESNGGTEYKKETYNRNTTVKINKTPEKEGYVFEGWYEDKELTKSVNEVKMTKNITVYAAWVEDNGTAGNGHDTPGSLNSKDHFAYVVGYPDGTVRPNANIDRAEVTTIFFRLLKEEIRNVNLADTNLFRDISDKDWHNTAISTMTKLGIVKGRYVDRFVPDAAITRAEFAAICARFDDSEFEVIDNFTDVDGHWAEDEIHEAAAHGWIRGYEDGTFKPDQFITRAEAMTMINRVLNRVPETEDDLLDDMVKWPDNSDEYMWYYLPVQEATNSHEYDMKNHIYEKWTALREITDWTKYE